jgi:DNA-binding CsgD family transcriptional regulator
MSVAVPDGERVRWDTLDVALARLRECRRAIDIAERVGSLALEGCAADAASFGTVNAGIWSEWCRAGPPESLDDVPEEPRPVRERADGRRRVVTPFEVSGQAYRLQVVTEADVDLEIVESFAAALASMMALVAVLQRAEEQQYVIARLVNGIGDVAQHAIEIVDTTPPTGPVRTGGDAARRVPPSPVRASLSPRQREVMDLMLRGLSNAEIAERLVVALPTVKSHVRAVLRAIGAVNRSDAIARMAWHDRMEA